jgi:hypothetical protein
MKRLILVLAVWAWANPVFAGETAGRPWRWAYRVEAATGVVEAAVVGVDGPLTNLMALSTRTDSNGYLMVTANAVTGQTTPLTPMASLSGRTDSNGYLMVALGALSVNAIATTSTDGFTVQNATAATVGVPVQMSPRVKWCGAAYNSVSTLSETDCMFAEVLPVTAAGATTQTLKIGSTINGGAATYPLTVSSAGATAVVAGGKYGFAGVSNAIALNGTATAVQASDGGNYFYVAPAVVTVNSADLVLASAATGRFTFPTPTADGLASMTNNAKTIGVSIKIDALPTVSACGAGSPAVVAGSTPLSGAVTIGTTSVATCTITFGGTAFPSAPHCTGSVETSTAANARAMGYSASTTALVIVPSAAWADSSVVNWTCLSAK